LKDFATAEMLAAHTPHVLDAPKTNGPVRILCTRPDYNKRVFPERLRLSAANGVQDDFEMSKPWLELDDGRPDPRIQVSILPLRVLDFVWRDRKSTLYPGDTIVADLDLSLANLPVGTRIKVGTAVLQVSDLWNSGCAKWRARYGRAAHAWVSAPAHEPLRLRGILCSVVQDGEVAIGDQIQRS
jgi:hypothetical protein